MKLGHNVSAEQLKTVITRVENLEQTKAGFVEDIKDVYAEAKNNGFDVKAIKAIIKLRKLDAATREEQETILETYMRSLGMLPLLDEPQPEGD